MLRALWLVAGLALSTAVTPAFAGPLVEEAKKVVTGLEEMSGRPIAVLTRVDNDPGEFWYKATQALCEATGDNWCENELSFLTDTTNQLGWARVITYKDEEDKVKTVCALLPPRPNLNAGYAATALSGGMVISGPLLPSNEEMEAYLWLLHAGSCLAEAGGDQEQVRADAFATLALTLIEGDHQFVGAYAITPSRRFNALRNEEETRWATNIGERLLLELWKEETADVLRDIPCQVTVVPSDDLNTDFIERDAALPASDDCQSAAPTGFKTGKVTDKNLWIWTGDFGGPTFAMPPEPYVPFKMFDTYGEAMVYTWGASNQLAGIAY